MARAVVFYSKHTACLAPNRLGRAQTRPQQQRSPSQQQQHWPLRQQRQRWRLHDIGSRGSSSPYPYTYIRDHSSVGFSSSTVQPHSISSPALLAAIQQRGWRRGEVTPTVSKAAQPSSNKPLRQQQQAFARRVSAMSEACVAGTATQDSPRLQGGARSSADVSAAATAATLGDAEGGRIRTSGATASRRRLQHQRQCRRHLGHAAPRWSAPSAAIVQRQFCTHGYFSTAMLPAPASSISILVALLAPTAAAARSQPIASSSKPRRKHSRNGTNAQQRLSSLGIQPSASASCGLRQQQQRCSAPFEPQLQQVCYSQYRRQLRRALLQHQPCDAITLQQQQAAGGGGSCSAASAVRSQRLLLRSSISVQHTLSAPQQHLSGSDDMQHPWSAAAAPTPQR
jgi:hypothetical protein